MWESWILHTSTPYKNFFLEIYSPNKDKYLFLISSSLSQVVSASEWFFQSTFTNGIFLFLNYFSSFSKICTGSSS